MPSPKAQIHLRQKSKYTLILGGVAYQLDTWIAPNTLQTIGFDKKAYQDLWNQNFDHWLLRKDLFLKDLVLPHAHNPLRVTDLILLPPIASSFDPSFSPISRLTTPFERIPKLYIYWKEVKASQTRIRVKLRVKLEKFSNIYNQDLPLETSSVLEYS